MLPLREMLQERILDFCCQLMSESSQREKQRMDRVIAAIGLSLVALKVMLEANGAKSMDNLNSQVLRLIEKITDVLIMGS